MWVTVKLADSPKLSGKFDWISNFDENLILFWEIKIQHVTELK